MSAHLTRPAYTPTTLLASPSGRRHASAPARPAVPIGLRFHATATLKIQPRPRSFFSPPPRAGLRLVEPGEADADVPYTTPEQANAFAAALADPALCATVLAQAQAAGRGATATSAVWVEGAAFVPSAWSPATPRGVPPAWNELAGKEDHVVIQVPPPVTYSVRVPGRVCAIYRLE